MAATRVYLGWDSPCLHRAAEWLLARTAAHAADFSDLLIVVPGARAGRRLLEILAERSAGRPLLPPEIITPGSLPEHLYRPAAPIAGEWESLFAWTRAARDTPADRIAQLTPRPPEAGDAAGWAALAREFIALQHELAAEAIDIVDLPELLSRAALLEDNRWPVIADIAERARCAITSLGRADADAARLDALRHGGISCARHIILLATADLPGIAARMLRLLPGNDEHVTALIHAPDGEHAAFDDLGVLIPAKWSDRPLHIDPSIVRVVDRPIDQALETLRLLSDDANGTRVNEKYAVDEITLGVGDAATAPMLERTLELGGVPARWPIAGSFAQSRPATLLRTLARFAQSKRLDDLAALLRHGDIEAYLRATLSGDGDADRSGGDDWLTLLDTYITDHLQRRAAGVWLGKEGRAASLKRVHDSVIALLPDGATVSRRTHEWREGIATALGRVYESSKLNPANPRDASVIQSLQAIGDELRAWTALPDDAAGNAPKTPFAQAVMMLLDALSNRPLTREAGPPAVEMLSYLELQLDDAPALIITGVNEGKIPQSVSADAFLPDAARRELGLPDNVRRYARDLYAMTAILASRPFVRLVSGRRGAQGDPLTPSRLLLACKGDELSRRVLHYYGDKAAVRPPAGVFSHAQRGAFRVPRPVPPATPITKLGVTAFADYIACKYRFYLKHVRKLRGVDDESTELDAPEFGSVAHDVLHDLALADEATSPDPQVVSRFLDDRLDRRFAARHGKQLPGAVFVQREMLRSRLRAFAAWQARQVSEGWRIITKAAEREVSGTLDVDGVAFTITARIDRIDQHAEHGHRVIDYKTGDSLTKPEPAHFTESKGWINLQLPLYRFIVTQAGMKGPITLGYVALPKKAEGAGFYAAGWSPEQLAEAIEEARKIVRGIRKNAFWPPTYPAPHADEFSRICMDDVLDRRDALRNDDTADAPGTTARRPARGGER